MDDQNGVQTSAPETASAEAGATSESQVATSDQEVKTEGQQAETSTPKKEEIISNSEGEHRPTRQSRRIEKLIGKLKEKEQPKREDANPEFDRLFGLNSPPPLIRPEEAETGVDPQELERRQQIREMSLERRIKADLAADAQFKEQVRNHLADAEKTMEALKDDEVLDEIVAEQYRLANYTVNPLTGQEEFIPRVRMSDIYSKQKRLLDMKIAKATADVSGKLADTAATGAVSPSIKGETSKNHELESAFEDAKSSDGSTEKWAEYFKKRGL